MERTPPRLRFVFISSYVDITVLPHAPKDWQNIKLNYHRSDVYYGMVRSFSLPITYVKDGAYLLRKAFYGDPATGRIGQASQANVQLRIEKYNTITYGYDIIYQADNDFSTFQDHGIEDGDVVTIEIMEGGISKYVKAYEDSKFTIPIPTTGPNVRIINSTPIKLRENAQLILQTGTLDPNNGEFPALGIVSNEQKAVNASVFDQSSIVYDGSPNFATAGCFFYRATISGKVRFTNVAINGFFIVPLPGSNDCEVSIYNSNGTEVAQLIARTNPGNLETFSLTSDFTINVVAGDRLFFYTRSNSNACFAAFNDGSWSMAYDTISPETQIYAVSGSYLYQQLMDRMNGYVGVPIRSSLLAQWDGLLLTSGNAIVPFTPSPIYNDGTLVEGLIYQVYTDNITYNGHVYIPGQQFTAVAVPSFFSVDDNAYVQQAQVAPVIITSFKDFFTSVNAVLNASWQVENYVATLESKSYAYKYALPPINVGKVAKFVGGKPSISNLYSSAIYGYDDQSYDQYNGSAEFNSTATVTFPLSRINKILDIKSVYRADSMGFELLRVGLNQSSQGSSSTSGNNDIWMVYCLSDGGNWRPEPAAAFANVSGLATNLWNLRISPRENLTRWFDYLSGVLYGLNGEYIRFGSGLKNVNLSRVGSNGQVITENADIAIGDLPQSYFIPMEATITTAEPFNMLYMLDHFATGSIQFEVHSGMQLTGYILDCNTDIPLNTPQEISVLYTINNNLLECVR